MSSVEQHQIGDWETQCALGSWPRLTNIQKVGQNPVIASTSEELWPLGGAHTWLAAGTTLFITSDDAGDADTMRVMGLDANWTLQTVDVVLNGLTPVQVGDALNWVEVQRVFQASAAPKATGDIYVAVAGAAYTLGVPDDTADVQAYVDMGSAGAPNQTTQLWMTIPSGYNGVIYDWTAELEESVGVARTAELHLEVAELVDGSTPDALSWTPFRKINDLTLATQAGVHRTLDFKIPFAFGPYTRVRVTAVATADSIVGGHISMLRVPI